MHADTLCNNKWPTQFDVNDLVWRLLKNGGHRTEAGIALRVRLYLGDFHGR
jgi:hypothetical protein